MKPARRRCCASATTATATIADRAGRAATGRIAATVEIEATGRIGAIVRRAAPAMTRILESADGHRSPPPVFPPAQVVPIHGRQRAEDRLQGHPSLVALHLRTREDRAVADYRGERRQAARARAGDQARAVPGPVALRDPVMASGRPRRL